MRKSNLFQLYLIAATVFLQTACSTSSEQPADGRLLPVEYHGRTIGAVNYPKMYQSFETLSNKNQFEKKWLENPGWILANMSHVAYYDHNQIERRLSDFDLEIRFYQDGEGGEAFLAIDQDKAFLSFRGTVPSDLDDLLVDANFLQKKYKGAYLHKGFLEATESLWNKRGIEKDLKELGNRKIYVTGHSLGGAMAVIASMNYDFEKVVTFGEPRVGTNLCSPLNDPSGHIRFVNGNDLVTTLPPESPAYIHHGIEQLIPVVNDYQPNDSFLDHSIINYADRIKTMDTRFLLDRHEAN